MPKINDLFIASLCLLLSACGADSSVTLASSESLVKVFKSDQSKQCEDSGIAADTMRKELLTAGIDVLCAQKSHDGMMRPAMCGGASGAINVYLIHSSNLGDATALGYTPVAELPGYQDKVCEK